jgi:molecular chaperone DnaK
MSNTINYGIDLGTTNSLIAKYTSGSVDIFKNPISLKDTLPSVVAFRKERIIVGDKAREMVEKDPSNVFSLFKRKMGTNESFFVKTLGEERSPIQLSALVLRELKNFVPSEEAINSVVITIPASFDTIQSNATKKAGYEAGFQEVVLLQEPIAASLAFANKPENQDHLDGQWLVYDLGGGTFDVALVRFDEGEMRVIDHEGDNFLGGLDFDNLLIEKVIVPHLERKGNFGNMMPQLLAADGRYNKLYYELRIKAEEVKIQLSNQKSTEIEFMIEDLDGEEQEIYLEIYREQFENIIRPKIADTIDNIKTLLEKNSLQNTDIQQIILIGGSSYIPLVKQLIASELQIKVNQTIDPTNAVAVGAAFFAGSKSKNTSSTFAQQDNVSSSNAAVSLRSAYQKTTQDMEEYYIANVTGATSDMTFRITRNDGGYDSGVKTLTDRISEILPLMRNQINQFWVKIFDKNGNPLSVENAQIEIVQGKFSLYGQPLPNDICIEIDDFENNQTKLEVVFEKNAILPLKKTIVRTVSKNIARGSQDSLIINVLEGNRFASAAACLPLGIIEFKGENLPMTLVKGSDVEITLEISESRDLKITGVLLMTDQEASDVFSPSARAVNIEKLKVEILEMLRVARRELRDLERHEDYILAGKVNKAILALAEMQETLQSRNENDVTDVRYQIEEKKRKTAQLLDGISNEMKTESVKTDYFDSKREAENWIQNATENESLSRRFERITQNEREFLASNNANLIKSKTRELNQLAWEVQQNDPVFLSMLFHHYASMDNYSDENKANHFRKIGEQALQRQNYHELRAAIYGLYGLLPPEQRIDDAIKGTGLS